MKLICLTILLVFSIDNVLSAYYYGEVSARAGKCYYSKKKIYLAPGETTYLAGCRQLLCTKKLRKYYLEILSCGAVERECRIPGDPNLNYPHCCSKNGCV